MAEYTKNPDVIATLSPEEFYVTQESGTERPGTGKLLNNKEPGIYVDIVSGEPLFASGDKYESGCGWLYQTDRACPCRRVDRHHPWHGPDRSAQQTRRQPSGPRLSRWPA